MSITTKINAFQKRGQSDQHHRYYSWVYCYRYFQSSWNDGGFTSKDEAALQLGFYLASWGMYRGSGFLLKKAYTIHIDTVQLLLEKRWRPLWCTEFGVRFNDQELIDLALKLFKSIHQCYRSNDSSIPTNQPSDTLITKILLGTVGCLPACDRCFVAAFKHEKNPFSSVNEKFIYRLIEFCGENVRELNAIQRSIEQKDGFRFPIMKLVDMYFYQVGRDLDSNSEKD